MGVSHYVFLFFELLGTVAFALSGAMVAIEKRADVFGVLVLAVITATEVVYCGMCCWAVCRPGCFSIV